MKTLAVSMILALGLAAPAIAEPPAPAPATTETTTDATPADASPIEEAAILEVASPEAHARLLLKCAGPPPRPPKVAETKPASTTSSGG